MAIRYSKKLWSIKFGYNLERVMKYLGVSQRELSQRTGIHQTTIRSYIRGDYSPSITSVISMAQALGVEYFVLMDVDGDIQIKTCERDQNDIISELDWLSDFSWKFRSLVRSEDISQRELSEITGISQGLISKYLKGTTIPSAYAVAQIAEALAYNDDYDEILDFGIVSINRHY